jgi:hypothetical protein
MSQPQLTHPVYTKGSVTSIEQAKASINQRFEEYSPKKYVNFVTGKDFEQSELEELQNSFPDHKITRTGFGYYEVTPK